MDYQDKIDELISDGKKFDQIVYTPIEEAMKKLEERWVDPELNLIVQRYLSTEVPDVMRGAPRAILFRQIATPNNESFQFLKASKTTGLVPVFFEYFDDKFTSNNELKHYLGKIGFDYGVGKKGGKKIVRKKAIDFNESNGKKIKDIKTLWGQSFIDFHHSLLKTAFLKENYLLYDASKWFHDNGGCASQYYFKYLALFIRHGILFENFILKGTETSFIKEVFLPAFFDVWQKTGKKPLIVALEPTDTADDESWLCHPRDFVKFVEKEMRGDYNYIKMKTRKKIIQVLGVLTILLVVAASYYNFFIKNDFTVTKQIECDPTAEACFVSDCASNDSECDPTFTYKKIAVPSKYAGADYDSLTCADNSQTCQIITCQDSTIEPGEKCFE